jgi:hypothetical protein
MTKCAIGQRLLAPNRQRLIEAIASYGDDREHDWVYLDSGEPAGRHKLRAMLDGGWRPIDGVRG